MTNIPLSNYFKLEVKDASVEKKGKKRALLVDLEMSASARRTNKRIYTPHGHRAGLQSWLHPYKKPVQINHDDDVNRTIGRLVSVNWESLDQEALKYLGGNYKALSALKGAYDAGDPMAIYDAMLKYDAFRPEWPGLGRVVGKVRIVDEDAIEKFLDGRYQTWSAGQSTDAYYCMNCGAAWHKNEMCEHVSDSDEEGRPVVHMCGVMTGREISVVSTPANDRSLTLKMQLMDSAEGPTTKFVPVLDILSDAPTIIPTITEEKPMNLADLESLDIMALIDLLEPEDKFQEFGDALKADNAYEIGWLIRIHDALHDQYDYRIKYGADEALNRMPRAAFKLHGMLHDLSMEKGFRDSITNGELDHFDAKGDKNDAYMIKPIVTAQDNSKEIVLKDDQFQELAKQLLEKLTALQAPAKEEKKDGDEEKEDKEGEGVLATESEPAKEEDSQPAPEADPEPAVEADPEDTSDIDWELLELALQAELTNEGVEDAKLSSEKREKLPASSFCGPDRSFPVPDCAHVTAARRLIGRAKLSADQKKRVLSCVDRKAKSLGCDKSEDSACKCGGKCKTIDTLQGKYEDLKGDLGKALKDLEFAREKLTDSLRQLAKQADAPKELFDAKLDKLMDWFDNRSQEGKGQVKPVLSEPASLKPTENPNAKVTDHSKSTDKELSDFEKNIVAKYKTLLVNDGKPVADRYLNQVARYLPKHFDITSHVKTEE